MVFFSHKMVSEPVPNPLLTWATFILICRSLSVSRRRHKDRTIYARNCGQGSCQRKERLQISPTSIERRKEKYDRRNLRLQHGSKKGSGKGDGKSSNQNCNLQKKKKVLQLARMGMPQYFAHHF